MKGTPRISVITVCLNAAPTLAQALDSVLAQSPFEYIVVDGGSTDGTGKILESYRPRLTTVISEPDRGIYDAFNKGIRLAGGDVIGLLNADDAYAPWALRTVAEAFAAHPDADVLYGKLATLDEARGRWTVYPLGDPRGLKDHMSIAHAASFVSRRAYESHGLFDPEFRISGDWDLMLRFWGEGAVFRPIDAVLTAFRDSGVSSGYPARILRENARIYRENLPALSAWGKIVKMRLKAQGRGLMDALGLRNAYARLRDARLLQVERSGPFDGDLAPVWEALHPEASS